MSYRWEDPNPDYTGAMNEWALVVGQDRPDRAWLLSDYDVWVVNPHYTGPRQPHPEDYDDGDVELPPLREPVFGPPRVWPDDSPF